MENINRMNRSAEKLCIPHIPEDVFLKALKMLVEVDQDWVPSEPDTSLYIRPFVFATDAHSVPITVPAKSVVSATWKD